MQKQEILNTVKKAIDQSVSGLEIENSKFDFKLKWYLLSDEHGKNEFVKDLSAIANTYGPDGFLVIGYNDRMKTFETSPFNASGLRDTSDMIDLVNKRVDRIFNFDLHQMIYNGIVISILHVPPSIDKPHVIRHYLSYKGSGTPREAFNSVFVRKGTRTMNASRTDYELMAYDKKNIVPEYRILSSCYYASIHMRTEWDQVAKNYIYHCVIPLTLENTGARPVSISSFKINLLVKISNGVVEHDTNSYKNYLSQTIILQPGEMRNHEIKFITYPKINENPEDKRQTFEYIEKHRKELENTAVELTLSNGTTISSDLTISKQ